MERIEVAFDTYVFITYFLIVIGLFGIQLIKPFYKKIIGTTFSVLVAMALIYKFNPFKHQYIITSFEKQLIFSAGIGLLATSLGENLDWLRGRHK
jgi:hypothetical protein